MLQPRTNFEKRANNAVAFMTSFVIHVVVLLVVASIAFTIGKDSHGVMLNADIGNSEEIGFDAVEVEGVEAPVELLDITPPPVEPMAAPSLANLEVSSATAKKPADTGAKPDVSLASASLAGGGWRWRQRFSRKFIVGCDEEARCGVFWGLC